MSAYSEDKQGQKFINFPRRVTRFCGKTKMRASTTIFTQRPAEKAEDQYLSEIKHASSSLCIAVKFFFFVAHCMPAYTKLKCAVILFNTMFQKLFQLHW